MHGEDIYKEGPAGRWPPQQQRQQQHHHHHQQQQQRRIKNRRRWRWDMNLTLFMINLAYLSQPTVEAVDYIAEGTCTPDQQRDILQGVETVTGCEARETLIDLKEHMPNVSNVIQVLPDFSTVRRCGGSCHQQSHRCVPTEVRTRRMEVMIVLSRFSSIQAEFECGYVDVEEHVGCRCDCPVKPEECRADQYYEPGSCRCLCKDQASREGCILRGMTWDPVNCMCICPMALWKVCSTGYIFDFTQSCHCVPTSTTASTGLVAAIIVLGICLVVTTTGGYIMYRRQVGLFKRRSRRNTVVAIEADGVDGTKNLVQVDLAKEKLTLDLDENGELPAEEAGSGRRKASLASGSSASRKVSR